MNDSPEDAAREGDVSDVRTVASQVGRRSLQPGVLLAERFDIGERLGAGGMGQVFAAWDRRLHRRVAVKVLGALTNDSVAQMKREFRSAAELMHPNLVRLYELFSEGEEWFFTMELVDGVTLTDALREPTFDHEALRVVLRQLAQGLTHLHQAKTLHRDLKPSNFLIERGTGRVVLLDFGLAAPIEPPGSGVIERELAGTPAYMSPEQVLGQPLSEASDWYAFGVVLYEALTGELPLRKPSATRLRHLPEALTSLCLELLYLHPEGRPSGGEVLRRLGAEAVVAPRSLPPPAQQTLLGRERELGLLEAEFQRTLSGHAALVLVHGPSGIGKSALVEAFAERVQARGALVLTSRCRERESMTYKALDGLIDGVVALLEGLPSGESTDLLPAEASKLTLLFPALRAAAGMTDSSRAGVVPRDQRVARLRAIRAFKDLVARLRLRGPLVLWIDDLQWGDRESALLLGPLMSGPGAVPVLLVASYRSGAPGPTLDVLLTDKQFTPPPPVDVALPPLPPDAAAALARAILGDTPRAGAVAEAIGRDAGGHPLFIAELAHRAAHPESGPENVPEGVAPSAAPTSLSALVAERVRSLPQEERGLMELCAVAVTPLARAVLRDASRLSPSRMEEALDVLKASRLVRTRGLKDEDVVEAHHDRVREIVLAGLGGANLRDLHGELARVLEARGDAKPEILAAHHEAAGDRERAGRLYLLAARRAMKALAFGYAAELFEKGLLNATLTPAEAEEIQLLRADALAHGGRGHAAADVYLAIAASRGEGEGLELRRRAGEQLLLSGHLERGVAVLEQVLSSLGLGGTRTGKRALLSFAAGRVLVRARGLRHVPRAERELSPAELARLDASWAVASGLGMLDYIRGADFQNRHFLLALSAGEPMRLLRALTAEAAYAAASGVGSERRVGEVLALADTLSRRLAEPRGRGLFYLTTGVAAYLQERLEAALEHLDTAIHHLAQQGAGAMWETLSAKRFVIASLFFLGELRRLSEFVPPLLAEAEGTGNRYASMCFRSAYSAVAWLARDQVDVTRRQLDVAREDCRDGVYQLPHCNLLIGESFFDLYVGEPERALRRLVEQWPIIDREQLLRIGVLRVQLLHLRAATLAAAARTLDERGEPRRARALRVEARSYAEELARDASRRARPLASLVQAALADAEGRRDEALRHLRRAASAFDRDRLRAFAAATAIRLGGLIGPEGGGELEARGRLVLEREGVVRPERMVELLAPGFVPRR